MFSPIWPLKLQNIGWATLTERKPIFSSVFPFDRVWSTFWIVIFTTRGNPKFFFVMQKHFLRPQITYTVDLDMLRRNFWKKWSEGILLIHTPKPTEKGDGKPTQKPSLYNPDIELKYNMKKNTITKTGTFYHFWSSSSIKLKNRKIIVGFASR